VIKKCSKCKEDKIIEEFNFKNKSLNKRHSNCRSCTRKLIKNHYNKNRSYYLEKAHKRNHKIRQKIFDYIKDYLVKNPCVDCGESDMVVLEFDHRGDTPKVKAVSQLIRLRVNLQRIKAEIAKCDVRCANCHRRKTAKDFNWFKNYNMHP